MSHYSYTQADDTIIALATPPGKGAIAVLRLSGKDAIKAVNHVFKGKNLEKQASHTVHLGKLFDGDEMIDEVLATLFIEPKSYTGENTVEIAAHGSPFIVKKIVSLFLKNGLRYAKPGEFTQRAFRNGRFDLAQAEAVADLIDSDSEASHKAALQQMRGGFSDEIKRMRSKLVDFASLIELELDFSEEDVEFADREGLLKLVGELRGLVGGLRDSFALGNVIKNGVPTVIAGKPNAGKSTLLNALLNEDKAIVSSIAGTTRDFIEDEISIGGLSFRFIDTAGLRDDAADEIEAIGVQRTRAKMREAALIVYLFDVATADAEGLREEISLLQALEVPYLLVGNKSDLPGKTAFAEIPGILYISAHDKADVENLKQKILEKTQLDGFRSGDVLVTNLRHFEALQETHKALSEVIDGLQNHVTGDFLAQDIRQALHYLGEITGEITTDDLLGNIFGKFCIGK